MPGEREIVATRQHWSIVAPALVAVGMAAVLGLVAIALVPGRIAGFDVNRARAAAAIAAVLLAAGGAALRYLKWRCRRYVLTNQRVMIESGVLSRDVRSIALDRIQNTVIHRPLGDRVIGAGNIEIESAGRDGTESLVRVPRCEDFYAQLLQAAERATRAEAL